LNEVAVLVPIGFNDSVKGLGVFVNVGVNPHDNIAWDLFRNRNLHQINPRHFNFEFEHCGRALLHDFELGVREQKHLLFSWKV
jgi:hypothetical protein